MILAIDPGKTGGVAVIDDRGLRACAKFRDTPHSTVLQNGVYNFCISEAVVEQVGASRQMSQAAAFEFGRNCGAWEGWASERLDPLVETVRPQVWEFWVKKHYYKAQDHPGEDAWKTDHKKTLQRIAWKIWPEHQKKLTKATCDAALIGLYWLEKGGESGHQSR